MKAIELYSLLKAKERIELDNRVAEHKRENLKKVHAFIKEALLSKRENTDNKSLYRALSKSKFPNQKDFLIRNELRVYTTLIKNFLVKTKIDEELKNDEHLFNQYYIKALHERKSALIDTEFNNAYKKACQQEQHIRAVNMSSIYFNKLVNSRYQSKELFEKALQLSQENEVNLIKSFNLKLNTVRLEIAYCENRFKENIPDFKLTKFSNQLSLDDKKYASSFSTYLNLRLQIYQSTDTFTRIQLLEKLLLQFMNLPNLYNQDPVFEKIMILSSIAREYFKIGKVEAADHYFKQVVNFADKNQKDISANIYANFLLNSLFVGKYSRIITLSDKIIAEKHLEENELFSIIKLKVYALLYQRKYKKAVELIRKNENGLKKYSEPHIYRFMFIIPSLLKNDLASAMRETVNLENVLMLNNEDQPALTLVRYYKRFISYLEMMPGEKQDRQLIKLLEELKEQLGITYKVYRLYPFMLWLSQELDIMVKKRITA